MFEKFLQRVANDLVTRLMVTGIIVVLPTALTTAWISAAFQTLLWQKDFTTVLVQLIVFGGIPIYTVGLLMLYFVERWYIRDRALQSWRWGVGRVLLYMAAGIPEGWACLAGIRMGMGEFPASIEDFYFVETIVISVLVGVVYSLVERAVAEVRKREAGYKKQIESLRIEIDYMKREQQVKEIIETDFFHDLQQKAQGMRNRAESTA
jgi:hypothetical protein